jgi:hypothetical protein
MRVSAKRKIWRGDAHLSVKNSTLSEPELPKKNHPNAHELYSKHLAQFFTKTLTLQSTEERNTSPRQLRWKIYFGYEQNGKCLFDAEAQ